jgi:hypothetical protein
VLVKQARGEQRHALLQDHLHRQQGHELVGVRLHVGDVAPAQPGGQEQYTPQGQE